MADVCTHKQVQRQFLLNLSRLCLSFATLLVVLIRTLDIRIFILVIIVNIFFTTWDFVLIIQTFNTLETASDEKKDKYEKDTSLVSATDCMLTSFQDAFRNIGVDIEKCFEQLGDSMNSLYCSPAFNAQAFANCLILMLRDAQENWMDYMLLSPREREILQLLAKNMSYREISRMLFLSQSTVKTHVYHIFQKMNTSNREETVCVARVRGWLKIVDEPKKT